MGNHRVVGIDTLLTIIIFLVVNYYLIYLCIRQVLKKSEIRSDIKNLKIELEIVKKLLEEKKDK